MRLRSGEALCEALMQTQKSLAPTTDIAGGRSTFNEGGMVVLLHLLLLFETALVFGFTPPECHMWKKKLGLFLLFRLSLLRLKSATVVFTLIDHSSPQNLTTRRLIYHVVLGLGRRLVC
jgi:hypothetical protein